MADDDMEHVTRGEFRAFREEMHTGLAAFRDEMRAEFARVMRAMEEHFTRLFGILDDKYRHVPAELSALRREHELHVADPSVHRAPRRTRRAKPRT